MRPAPVGGWGRRIRDLPARHLTPDSMQESEQFSEEGDDLTEEEDHLTELEKSFGPQLAVVEEAARKMKRRQKRFTKRLVTYVEPLKQLPNVQVPVAAELGVAEQETSSDAGEQHYRPSSI